MKKKNKTTRKYISAGNQIKELVTKENFVSKTQFDMLKINTPRLSLSKEVNNISHLAK